MVDKKKPDLMTVKDFDAKHPTFKTAAFRLKLITCHKLQDKLGPITLLVFIVCGLSPGLSDTLLGYALTAILIYEGFTTLMRLSLLFLTTKIVIEFNKLKN